MLIPLSFLSLSTHLLALVTAQDQGLSFTQADVTASKSSLITRNGRRYACKCYPGDSCYPKPATWSQFNQTVGGNLQLAIPPGAPCFNFLDGAIPTYNEAQCAEVQANWFNEQWNTDHPISNLWSFWTNDTCVPLGVLPTDTCTRGYYGNYLVLAKTRAHVKATVDFARKNNVRLVIRNTGHDFMGRSTGFGSLILNTHSFKDVTFHKKWTGPGQWRGGAVTIGAGVQGRELLRQANQQNPPQAIVTGECPTVGFAGGYIQGGGHGPLASIYGLAADQVLSFDVVTSSGVYLTANNKQNPSLFWALKGGGPSTFAAILTVTVKTFPDLPSSSVVLRINSTHTSDPEVFWKGVNAFHELSTRYVENGLFVYYELGELRLNVRPFVAPNMTSAQLDAVVKPLFDKLDAEGIPYDREDNHFPSFFDLYLGIFDDEGSFAQMITGGRIFTKSDFRRDAGSINSAQRFAVEQGSFIIGHIVGPGTGAPRVDNAIHPRWRDAASFSITGLGIAGNASLTEKARVQNLVTNVVGKALRDASPKGAAYVNEGDLEEPNWQSEYWGSNYPRLFALKKVYDPLGVFYARTTPGTEDWEVIDVGTKLCRKL